MSYIGGGTTTFPPADGTWIDGDGNVIWEITRIVFCYVKPEEFRRRIRELRAFLHRFGRETNQGEVVAEFDGRFYRINDFDQENIVKS